MPELVAKGAKSGAGQLAEHITRHQAENTKILDALCGLGYESKSLYLIGKVLLTSLKTFVDGKVVWLLANSITLRNHLC